MNKTASEQHLLVFWRWPKERLDDTLGKIEEHFEINRVARLHWTEDRIVENFQRFYAMPSGHAYQKFTEAGVLPFLFVLVTDRDPVYQYRVAGGSGLKWVNIKSFDLKQVLRRQGGTSLHATNNPREFRRDYIYLTGERAANIQVRPWDGQVDDMHRDVVAAEGWQSLGQVFTVLNEAIDYVVLRNFDKLPDQHRHGEHGDIDLLVEDVDARNRGASILNKEQRAHTVVGGERVYIDFRSVEDFYYDPEWCRRILRDKALLRGFYVPCPEDHFFSLLYHGHVHKPKIAKDYIPRLMRLAGEIGLDWVTPEHLTNPDKAAALLGDWLKGNGYYLTRPNGCPQYNPEFVDKVANAPFLYQSVSNLSGILGRVGDLGNALFADAIALRDTGNVGGAVALLKRARELNPASGEIRDELERLTTLADAERADRRRQAETAKALFADAIAVRDSGRIEAAVALLVRALQLHPASGEIRDELARLLDQLEGKGGMAVAIADNGTDALTQRVRALARAILAQATGAREAGDMAGALALMERARDLDPGSAEIREALAGLLCRRHPPKRGLFSGGANAPSRLRV